MFNRNFTLEKLLFSTLKHSKIINFRLKSLFFAQMHLFFRSNDAGGGAPGRGPPPAVGGGVPGGNRGGGGGASGPVDIQKVFFFVSIDWYIE